METMTAPAATTPNGARPGVVFAHRWVWVDYPAPDPDDDADADDEAWQPNPDYQGFRALILKNPNGQEEIDERQAFVALAKRDITEDEYLEGIAWRVREWNALSGDDDGNVVPIPAPGEHPGNWPAWRAIPSDLCAWLVQEVRGANRPKSRTTPSSRRAGTTAAPTPLRPRDTPPEPETE